MRKLPDSFFDPITKDEIAALIQEEELRQKNYVFYYVIDTYDIINYCYPFNRFSDDVSLNKDYIFSEQLTFTEFFNSEEQLVLSDVVENSVNTPLLFFDEYKPEFTKLRESIERMTKYQDYNRKTLEKKVHEYLDKDPDKILNSSEFVTLLCASNGVAVSTLEKFNNLKNRLRIEESDFLGDELPSAFIECFQTFKSSEIAFQLLSEIKDRYRLSEDETESETYRYFLQKYRDCCVVDRIIQINKHLEAESIKDNSGKRICLLFLSSDASARTLFSKFMDKYCPLIGGQKFPFFRNTGQLFLQLLCDNKSNPNRYEYKEMLRNAKKAAEDKENNIDNRYFSSFLQKEYSKKINDVRKPIQFNGLESFFRERDIIANATYTQPNENTHERIRELLAQAKKQYSALQSQPVAFKNLESEHSLRSEFLESLKKIGKNSNAESIFLLIRGNDPIYGRNHHLPILFRLEGEFQVEIQHLITALLDDLDSNSQTKDILIEQLTKIAEAYLEKKTFTAEAFLMRAFLFMVLPFGEKTVHKSDDAIKDLELGKWLSKNEKNNALTKEFLYALCWANRRNKKYAEAIKNAKAGLEIDNADPRFYHGLALVYYSQYVDARTKEITILDNAIDNCETATRLYIDWYAKSTDSIIDTTDFNIAVNWFVNPKNRIHIGEPIELRFIRKNITVILFAIVLMRVLKFENHESTGNGLIENARGTLMKAKTLINENDYRKYPEYLYNEARLEYAESTLCNDISEKLDKLNHAKVALDKIQAPPNKERTEVTELKKEINNAIQQLNNPTTQH